MSSIQDSKRIMAAMDVAENGMLTGKGKYSDMQRVKAILPPHYEVRESKSPNAIHCRSKQGLRGENDSDDDEHWGYVQGALKQYFGPRFGSIFFNVCAWYTDFTIHPKDPTRTPLSSESGDDSE